MRELIALIVAISFTAVACQQYSTSIQEGVTRVDETAIIGAMRAIGTAQRTYSIANAGDYGTLDQLVQGGFLDERFASTPVKDYVLNLNVRTKAATNPEGFFSCSADPDGEKTGRHFYIDSTSNQIHVNPSRPATASDQILQ